MTEIRFSATPLCDEHQTRVTAGFEHHSAQHDAPAFSKEPISWSAIDTHENCIGALTAAVLWDWLYVDELWVAPEHRGTGLGKNLMEKAETYSRARCLSGVWLWTQSWQAPAFYTQLGYSEFTRFENFPAGHTRIGFRKTFARIDTN